MLLEDTGFNAIYMDLQFKVHPESHRTCRQNYKIGRHSGTEAIRFGEEKPGASADPDSVTS
jgi:hypothetical protein